MRHVPLGAGVVAVFCTLVCAASAQAALPSGIALDVDGDGRDDDVYVEQYAPWPNEKLRLGLVVAVARGRAAGAPQQLGGADVDGLRITTEGRVLQAFIVGDVNRDGLADIALVRRRAPKAKRELLVVAGRAGPGTLAATPSTSLLHRVLPTAEDDLSAVGDVDGDERADVLIHRNARTLLALHGGAPSERPTTIVRVVSVARDALLFSATGAGDVNGDGFDDLAIELETHAYSYCGEAECPGRSVVVWGGRRPRTVRVGGNMHDGYTLRAADGQPAGFVLNAEEVEAAGDVDGDRRDDLLAVFDTETGALVYGKRSTATVTGGRGGHRSSWRGLRGVSPFFGVDGGSVAGDTNGDGLGDVAVAIGGELRVLPGGRATRTWTATQRPGWRVRPPPGYELGTWTAAGDVNGDGLGDLWIGVERGPHDSRAFAVLGDRGHATVDLAAIGARGYEILDVD